MPEIVEGDAAGTLSGRRYRDQDDCGYQEWLRQLESDPRQARSTGISELMDHPPEALIQEAQLSDRGFHLGQRTGVDIGGLAHPDVALPISNPHQDGPRNTAFRIEGVDRMIVVIAQARQFKDVPGEFQHTGPLWGRDAIKLGQPFDEIHPRAHRIERQEDDDGSFLVGTGQSRDQMDQQAFRVGPGIVQLADQQQERVKQGRGISHCRAASCYLRARIGNGTKPRLPFDY